MSADAPNRTSEQRKIALLERKLERSETNRRLLEARHERIQTFLSGMIDHMSATEEALRRGNEELRAATAQLEASEQLAHQASRAKSTFLANMSHELRTPLNAIIGYAELIAEELEDRGIHDHADDLGHILRSGSHLLQLVDRVLDLSKIEAGRMELESMVFDPSRLLDEVVSASAGPPGHAAVPVRRFSEGLPPRVVADATKLRQVLINLVSNALKFTENGEVRITARWEGGIATFEVRDTGIGMTQEEAARVFEPFVQAGVSTRRLFGGTGLGLAICDRFVRLLGGRITVESNLGAGSVFTVTLPLPEAEPVPA